MIEITSVNELPVTEPAGTIAAEAEAFGERRAFAGARMSAPGSLGVTASRFGGSSRGSTPRDESLVNGGRS